MNNDLTYCNQIIYIKFIAQGLIPIYPPKTRLYFLGGSLARFGAIGWL